LKPPNGQTPPQATASQLQGAEQRLQAATEQVGCAPLFWLVVM
jgi:hypothetical protein